MEALIVGCGLSGAVVARELADNGWHVTVWDRRTHIGGNMYDYTDKYGILVHKYGPHIFHTSQKNIINYIKQFAEWREYKLICGAYIDEKFTPTPFNFKTIDDFYPKQDADNLKKHIISVFGDRKTATVIEVLNSTDPVVRSYGEFLFKKDYSLYTAKQWGVSPEEVDPSILKRVPLRFSYEMGYFDDEYQVMPKVSFTHFFEKLLDHPKIHIELGVEALERLHINEKALSIDGKKVEFPVVYTGALDELFEHRQGALPYRSLKFEWKHEKKDSIQPYAVVAYPQAEKFTRIVEFKQFLDHDIKETTYEVEYPLQYSPAKNFEPYYPLLTEESQKQYTYYAEAAKGIKYLYLCGRLADFKYYNMDQALDRALKTSASIINIYK